MFRIKWAVATLALVLAGASSAGQIVEAPSAYSPARGTGIAIPKLVEPIGEYCRERVLQAYAMCESLCGSSGIEEFDAGFCAVSTKCACAVREDQPGVQ